MPTTKQLEKDFQKKVIAAAKARGWRSWHVSDSRRQLANGAWVPDTAIAGWPDLMLAHYGRRRFILRELKTDTGRVDDRQQSVLDCLAICGLDTGVWRPRDWERIVAELEA